MHQGGCTTAAVKAQPLVVRAEADSSLRSKMVEGLGLLNVSTHRILPIDRCQSGVGVGGMDFEVSGLAVIPGPCRPRTTFLAEQTIVTKHLGHV